MTLKQFTVLCAALALAACAAPTTYKPAEGPHSTGYADQRLAENRYRVTFSGNSATRRERVEDYLLLRAAEVTRDAGYAWFVFDTRDTETRTTYRTEFYGWPGWGVHLGWYWHSWAFEHDATAVPITRYEAYAEIVLLSAEQAKRDEHALSAADVIARLGPSAEPPSPH